MRAIWPSSMRPTFHEGADYSERHAAVLGHFRRWEG